MNNGLSSKGALAYQGTNATTPPNVRIFSRAPTVNDYQNFSIGDFWIYRVSRTANDSELYVLLGVVQNVANWVLLSESTGTVTNLEGNSGGVVDPDGSGVINVIGDTTTIDVVGTPVNNTLTISAVGTGLIQGLHAQDGNTVTPTAGVINVSGGNNLTTTGTVGPDTLTLSLSGITQHSLQVGGAANALTQLGVATNGQLPIGSTGSNPVLATLTPGTGISIDNTVPGAITINNTQVSNAFDQIVVQKFTSSGTYTPTTGMKYCTIEAVGGGGGGGGCDATGAAEVACGGGAGGGGYGRSTVTAATIGASQTVTIGAGGAGGVGNASGVTGGTTSVGAIISAAGGVLGAGGSASGATLAVTAAAGEGGSASANLIVLGGGGGVPLGIAGANGSIIGGFGGGSYFGGLRVARSSNVAVTNDNGNAGHLYGGGGGGAISMQGGSAANGGAGADGIVIITEYVSV